MCSVVSRSILLIILATTVSASTPFMDFSAGRYNNVCKDLKNDALLYFVFVDTRTTSPWTEFDILTTIDSIRVASQWLEDQAAGMNVPLKIKTDYYIGDEFTTIEKNLPRKSIREIIENQKLEEGMKSLSRWGDNIAKTIGASLYLKQKDGIPAMKRPGNKERLIAYMRDEYQVESVAFLLLVNNYYKSDISLAVNTLHNDDVEFAVVSYKYPSEIVHSLLHLYGAADLSESPFRRNRRNIKLAGKLFPNDIMSDVYAKSLQVLEIGAFTSYMIGWTDELEQEFTPLLTERFTLFN
jgi:hypothetical protein